MPLGEVFDLGRAYSQAQNIKASQADMQERATRTQILDREQQRLQISDEQKQDATRKLAEYEALKDNPEFRARKTAEIKAAGGAQYANVTEEQAMSLYGAGLYHGAGVDRPSDEYGQPVAALDESNNAVFARFRKGQVGGDVVPGFRPTPKDTSPAGGTSLTVKTGEDFYGSLAKTEAGRFSGMADAAEKAPQMIERSERVIALLKATPYTGTAAEWKLAIGKGAKAAGFDYAGDDISNTELLGRELAAGTLDMIKASGLGSGTGFSNADRDFLERVAGGKISQDAKTLRRLAELNRRSAVVSMQRYNSRASKLDKIQLDVMGLPQAVEVPADIAELLKKY